MEIKDIEYLAKLARLELTQEEKELYLSQIDSILEYVGQIGELDTDSVDETVGVVQTPTVLRPDVVEACKDDVRDALLSSTDQMHEGMFKVKKVL